MKTNEKPFHSRIQLPLRLVLVVPFVAQTFAVVSLVGYLSFRNGERSINTLAKEIINKTNDSVANHLDSYLSVPQDINRINASAVKLGLLDVNNPEQAAQYFWGQLQTHSLTYVGYGLTTGAGAGAAKYDGKTITLEEWTGQLPNNVSNYAADDQGNRAGLNEKFDFDNFNETWYNEPVKAGRPIWSRIYVWSFPGGYPYITASAGRPIYDSNQQLLGMIAADVHLLKLSNFLKDLKISPSGQIFIMERNGMLIANSGSDKPFKLSGDDIQRVNVADSADPLTQAIIQALPQKLGRFEIVSQQDLNLRFQGDRYYIHAQPWRDEYGLDWVVVTVVPESDFMSTIDANSRTTFFLCLGALGVATLLGIFTSQQITRPIFKLSQASQKLAESARARFSEGTQHDRAMPIAVNVDRAGIQELDALADSFMLMAQQLQETFIELETLNEDLEGRVDLRTQELQNTLQELHRTQAKMLQSEKMSALGQMVAGVAHEVNNPINFIYGNLQYADSNIQDLLNLVDLYQRKQAQPDSEIDDWIESIDLTFIVEDLPKLMKSMHVGAERIREIVKSLRTFSRLDESDFKTADIHEGIDSTLMILQHRIKRKPDWPGVEIIKDYDDLPLIECYPGQLNQVIMNILSNALDALEAKTTLSAAEADLDKPGIFTELPLDRPAIRIQTRRLNSEWVTLTIADNGPGIPADVQTRLFDPFFTTKPVGKGTGLGLAICYEIIIQKHRGYLTCQSQLGEGTTFVIEIPAQQTQPAMSDKFASSKLIGPQLTL
ncbi:ATP-binding protein [Leptolyngbya sp. BC1307]|uniref:ATP-binding protein n=1 Tax=Leptolyngbya sp. BC1307 TaxID=2029589 RepID=UPI000EFB4D9F|nr:ATP-binding protein [Leptolyngbya sp. BC1307]